MFVTDADNREVLEYDGTSGAIQRWYAYALGPNDVLNQMNVVAGTRATLGAGHPRIDHRLAGFSSGTLTKVGYLPYGKSASTGPFGFTGQRIDPETGRALLLSRAALFAGVGAVSAGGPDRDMAAEAICMRMSGMIR